LKQMLKTKEGPAWPLFHVARVAKYSCYVSMIPVDLRQFHATWSRHSPGDFGMVNVTYLPKEERNFRPELDRLLRTPEFARKLKESLPAGATEVGTPEFQELIDRLSKIVSQSRGPKVSTWRRKLVAHVIVAKAIYITAKDRRERDITLRAASDPLDRALEALKHEPNREDILIALGAPAHTPRKDAEPLYAAAVECAEIQRQAIIDGLEKIARASSPISASKIGRPSERDLDEFVDHLAQEWERMTRTPFKHFWYQRVPKSPGCQFAYEILSYIDKGRLPDLPGATERVSKARRRTSGN
jgi:hypothetical protein